KSALEAIGRLVGKTEDDDTGLLSELGQKLSQVENGLPSVDVGFHLALLEVSTNLEIGATSYVRDRRRGLSRLLPWRAIASWPLWRRTRLLSLLEQAAETPDPRRRAQLATEIQRHTTPNDLTLTDALPVDWLEA